MPRARGCGYLTFLRSLSAAVLAYLRRFGGGPSRFPFAWVARVPALVLRVDFLFSGSGSCALAWAVKEVPASGAGPPDAELPRQTDIDPFAQG